MFKKILIANRGEIACRVIRTAKRMGIATVAVYSEADRNALHVEMADEAVAIGPPPAAQSYLSIERIVEAARGTGAEAVHPGYGFLSENPAFRPRARGGGHRLHRPAGRRRSRRWATRSRRRSSPPRPASRRCRAHLGVVADEDEAERIAVEIGFPVMIKASAGGGGKGMRVAYDAAALREGFRLAALGGALVVRRRPAVPRKIHRGAAPYRDPGSGRRARQRRPSRRARMLDPAAQPEGDRRGAVAVPRQDDARERWARQAVALAKAVGYQSAGTVEFIVDRDRNFYFLEMNTRLQVEHPVTELVTGLDLVEEMIRIAAGEKLRLQASRRSSRRLGDRGARLCRGSVPRVPAFDRAADALSPAGRRQDRRRHDPHRCRRRRRLGDIALLRSDDRQALRARADRAAAIDAMADALDAFSIDGIRHNIPVPRSADGASALARGKAFHRVHRAGISRGLSRR